MFDTKSLLRAWPSEGGAQRVLAVTFAALTTLLFLYVIYQRFFSPLAKLNGPFWASLSPAYKLYHMTKGNFHEMIVDLHEEYGPIVRIAPNEVIISDKTAIREIYSTTQGREFLKVRAHITPTFLNQLGTRLLTRPRLTTMSKLATLRYQPLILTCRSLRARSLLLDLQSSASEIPNFMPSASGSCRMATL